MTKKAKTPSSTICLNKKAGFDFFLQERFEAGVVLEGWEVMGGEYFAKKEWIKEDAGLGLVEAGTFKLYHRPGK